MNDLVEMRKAVEMHKPRTKLSESAHRIKFTFSLNCSIAFNNASRFPADVIQGGSRAAMLLEAVPPEEFLHKSTTSKLAKN